MKKSYEYRHSRIEESHKYGYFRTKEPYKYGYSIMKNLDGDIQSKHSFHIFHNCR